MVVDIMGMIKDQNISPVEKTGLAFKSMAQYFYKRQQGWNELKDVSFIDMN